MSALENASKVCRCGDHFVGPNLECPVCEAFREYQPPAHLAVLIEEEMEVRGWTAAVLVRKMDMTADRRQMAINALALDMFLEVRCPNMRLGIMAEQFGRAFDVSPYFFTNMHNAWVAQAPPCANSCCKSRVAH